MGEMRPKILGATSTRTSLVGAQRGGGVIGIGPGFHQFR